MHFIDENYDAGVIVAQRIVRVLPTDTPEELQARVLKEVRLHLFTGRCYSLSKRVIENLCGKRRTLLQPMQT